VCEKIDGPRYALAYIRKPGDTKTAGWRMLLGEIFGRHGEGKIHYLVAKKMRNLPFY
jgi:hypothetical protein